MKIRRKETSYWIELDGYDYKVFHSIANDYNSQHVYEQWHVFGSVGMHRYARLLDPDKLVHKRVVAAMKEELR